MNTTTSNGSASPSAILAAGAAMSDNSAQQATSEVKEGDQTTFTPKVTFTDNDREILSKALTSIHNVVKSMGKSEVSADFLSNPDTLGELLGRAHRVWKDDTAARRAKAREAFAVKVNEHLTSLLAKREKALKAYNALDADLRGELAAPSLTISVWVEDLLPFLPKGYDLAKATKVLHDMGYMVHAPKIDGRRKDAPTPAYLTCTVGQPIRTSAAVKDGAK